MAFTAADWSITRNGGALDVRYIGDAHAGTSPSYATTIELHRALQDFADDEQDSGDDELSIIDKTPSDRGGADTNITLLNGCNLLPADTEHVYDGSLTQAGGAEIFDGIQVFGNSDNIQVIQNGARIVNDFWNEPKMIAAVKDTASSTSHRFLIQVRDAGADIDGRKLLGTQRELATVYTEFFIGGGTNRGNNVLALTANIDNNNQTAEGTIAGWDDIVNDVEGYTGIDADGNTVNEFYYSDWELGAQTKNNFYERAKWIQTRVAGIGVDTPARDADQIIYGLPGDIFRGITHQIAVTDLASGIWAQGTPIAWTGGTGQLLAVDDTASGSATNIWIQLLTGVVPSAQTVTNATNGATGTSGAVTARNISLPFVGASTGSAILGAYGVGIGADDLTQNDKVVDLTNTTNTPPNNVTYTVNNTVIGDYVISAPNTGNDFQLDQLSITSAEVGASVTSIVFDETIPSDVLSPGGTIRVEQVSGSYKRIAYTSITTTTNPDDTINFSTLDFSGVGSGLAIGGNAFITYIDRVATGVTESATFVYSGSPRSLFTRVRNANPGNEIKTFETTASVGSGGGASTVGRIDDF